MTALARVKTNINKINEMEKLKKKCDKK